MTTIKEVKTNDYFKLKASSDIVYVKLGYDRGSKTYACCKFDDVNSFRYFKATKEVVVDFEF
jgi:hypothetical protein